MTTRLRRRRGSFLIEILVVVMLLAAVLLITSQIISSALRTQRDARNALEAGQHVDIALDLLRHDAWSARALAAPSSTHLDITGPDGRIIRWDYSSEGTLTRTLDANERHWSKFPTLQFTAKGPLLTLAFSLTQPNAGTHIETLTLPSQTLLAQTGGSRP